MAAIGEREALEACRTLFGEPADAAFLQALALPSVKRAFRQKALLLHPDRFAGGTPALQRRQTERFQAISGAYELLLAWLDQAQQHGARAAGTPARPPAPPPAAARPAPGPPPRRAPPPPPPRQAAPPPPPRPAPPPPPAAEAAPASARSRPAAPSSASGSASAGPRRAAAPAPGPDPVGPRPSAAAPGPVPPPGAPPVGAEGLGSFLYRHGLISQRTLLAALVWQRRGRLRVGELAVRWGWLTSAQVQEILRSASPEPRFADRAVALGLLTPFRARVLLRFQGLRQRRLGDYFVEHGVLDRDEVERLAALHRAGATRPAPPAAAPATAAPAAARRTASA